MTGQEDIECTCDVIRGTYLAFWTFGASLTSRDADVPARLSSCRTARTGRRCRATRSLAHLLANAGRSASQDLFSDRGRTPQGHRRDQYCRDLADGFVRFCFSRVRACAPARGEVTPANQCLPRLQSTASCTWSTRDTANSRCTTREWAWTRSRSRQSRKRTRTNGQVALAVLAQGKLTAPPSLLSCLTDRADPSLAVQYGLPPFHRDGIPRRAFREHHSRDSEDQSVEHGSPAQVARRQEPARVRLYGSSSSGAFIPMRQSLVALPLNPSPRRKISSTRCTSSGFSALSTTPAS